VQQEFMRGRVAGERQAHGVEAFLDALRDADFAFAVEQPTGIDINEIVLPDGAGDLPPTGIHADDALAAANPSALRL